MIQDKAQPVRQGEELDIAYLSDCLKTPIAEVKQYPGGFSNLTYQLITTEGVEWVLRRPPFGAAIKSGHDMRREFQVLSALKNAGYTTIPEPITEGVLADGTPFYVMQKLTGVILRAKDAHNPHLTPPLMTTLCERLVDNLATLHGLDIQNTGLIQLGKPDGYVERQVTGWIQRYKNAQTDAVADMETLAVWLSRYKPKAQTPTFLHNDYKFDNVVWDTHLTAIIGVLDWEMATVGDPLMDLGAALAYWCEPTDSDFTKMFNLTWREGCLTRQQVIDRYTTLTGRDLSDIDFYYIFGLFKNAVIIQQIYTRWKKGLTQDPRFAGLIAGVFELGKMGVKKIESGK